MSQDHFVESMQSSMFTVVKFLAFVLFSVNLCVCLLFCSSVSVIKLKKNKVSTKKKNVLIYMLLLLLTVCVEPYCCLSVYSRDSAQG